MQFQSSRQKCWIHINDWSHTWNPTEKSPDPGLKGQCDQILNLLEQKEETGKHQLHIKSIFLLSYLNFWSKGDSWRPSSYGRWAQRIWGAWQRKQNGTSLIQGRPRWRVLLWGEWAPGRLKKETAVLTSLVGPSRLDEIIGSLHCLWISQSAEVLNPIKCPKSTKTVLEG